MGSAAPLGGGWWRRSRAACGCSGDGWWWLAAAGEGGKGGGGSGGGGGGGGGIILMSYVEVLFFVSIFFSLVGGRNLVIGEVTPHRLPTTIVTRYCGCTNFLRTLGHGKGMVQTNLNSNPEGMSY